MTKHLPLIILLAGIVACGNSIKAPTPPSWGVTARVDLPTGLALDPFDAGQPGEAGVEAVAVANGQIVVAYTNLYQEEQPAGPSWLSFHDSTSLQLLTKIPLARGSGSDAVTCTNAGALLVTGNMILVACSGYESLMQTTASQAGMLAMVSLSDLDGGTDAGTSSTVTQIILTGGSPGSIAQFGANIWLGDTESVNLLRVDANSGEVLNGMGGAAPIPVCGPGTGGEQNFVSALIIVGDVGFAACLDTNTVQEFDPTTGDLIGSALNLPTNFDGPLAFASIDGQIAAIGTLSGTIAFLSPAGAVSSTVVDIGGTQGGNDPQGIAGDSMFAAVSDSGDGTLVIFDVATGYNIVGAVDVKDSPSAPTNWPEGVVDVNSVFYVAIAGWANGPPELVRIARFGD